MFFRRDPADKLIRHRACSLRDNAYALIKAELDSDFEDKCREISKNRKVIDEREVGKSTKGETPSPVDKTDKKYSTSPGGGSVVVNGRKFSSSRKRKIPAWARGYVKKVHKKKKIVFDDTPTEIVTKSSPPSEPVIDIDLEKFQDFETAANTVINGHAASFENSDSEHDSIIEKVKESKGTLNGSTAEVQIMPESSNAPVTTPVLDSKDAKVVEINNSGSSSSSRRESTDDLTFAIVSDSNPAEVGDSDKVIVDKADLENNWELTVSLTRDCSVEVLCDIYVQLSRCVGKFVHAYDRKSLPKVRKFNNFTRFLGGNYLKPGNFFKLVNNPRNIGRFSLHFLLSTIPFYFTIVFNLCSYISYLTFKGHIICSRHKEHTGSN